MTVEAYIRIVVFVLAGGWLAFTLPALVTGRWWVQGEATRWSQLSWHHRADVVRNGGGLLILALAAAFVPAGSLTIMFGLAVALPTVVTALWWRRVDFGHTHILKSERPAAYWATVLIGFLFIAAVLAVLIWAAPIVTTP